MVVFGLVDFRFTTRIFVMPKFRFEVVQTVDGLPDPSAYDEGLAHSHLSGAAKVVIEEFVDEETAKAQEVSHEEGRNSEVWQKHCPPLFRSGNGVGGLDVFYIGPYEERVKVGRHKGMNRFPHVLWRYILPKHLNTITRKPCEPKIYKWLWWHISVPTSL